MNAAAPSTGREERNQEKGRKSLTAGDLDNSASATKASQAPSSVSSSLRSSLPDVCCRYSAASSMKVLLAGWRGESTVRGYTGGTLSVESTSQAALVPPEEVG